MSALQQVLFASSSVGFQGIDAFSTGVTALHSLKRKWTGYVGNCIRVRRSSDNAEQDFGFVSPSIDALVDSGAIVTFCGAGSGFVTTIYDQCGLGNHWVQATAAKQPRCVLTGVWDGIVRFDGTDDSMQSVNNSGTVAVYNISAMFTKRSWGTPSDSILIERGTGLGGAAENGSAMTYAGSGVPWRMWKSAGIGNYAYNGTAAATDASRPTSTQAVWCYTDYTQALNIDSLKFFVAATEITSAAQATTGTVPIGTIGSAVKWFLGARNNTTFFADIDWAADLLVEGTVSASDRTTMQAILQR